MNPPEFSRPVRLDMLAQTPRAVDISARPGERDALAKRFGLLGIDRLEADAQVWRDAVGPIATIVVRADVVQACIGTGDPVTASITAEARLRYLPASGSVEGDEIELGADDCDTVFYEGGAIDLGEAAAETMALEIDPFPRSPAAEEALRAAGVKREDEVENAAFSGLAALRDKLQGK
jgi:hypothetical protein